MIRAVFLCIGFLATVGFTQESYLDRNLDPYASTVRYIEQFDLREEAGLFEGILGRWTGMSQTGIYNFDVIASDSVPGKKELAFSPGRYHYPGNILELLDLNGDRKADALVRIDKQIHWINDIRDSENKPKPLKKIGDFGDLLCINGTNQVFFKDETALNYYTGVPGEVHIDPIGTSVTYGKGKTQFLAYKSILLADMRISAMADIDSNSTMDFMLFNYSEPHIFMPQEMGKFNEADFLKLEGEWDENNTYFFMDWSASELLDLIEVNDTAVFLHPAKTKGVFEPRQLLFKADNGNNSFEHIVRDINGDGWQDLLLYSDDVVYLQNQDGKTAKSQKLGSERYDIKGGSIADINGDGHLDFLMNSYLGLLYFEQHHGHFHGPRIFELFKYAEFYYQNDMDGDGDLDLFVHDDGVPMLWIENKNGVMQEAEVWRF